MGALNTTCSVGESPLVPLVPDPLTATETDAAMPLCATTLQQLPRRSVHFRPFTLDKISTR